ncbi:allophanate hydrolase [Roseinatronobacter alkalisoli]|uniref:Allophanate hydrolase n=1 Tax=Roseinatronobacter alkalisoli TaxID=3028235 RepID=A0ABT5T767_9RHOB|nr:allophanate hydrolase [Roseinatronobacter sp. HJB301]MDD7970961.1 allophanate hydrolase [Roseinatronobacter sp. HJB301]
MSSLPSPLTICDLHTAYAAGVPVADVLQEIFARIKAVNDPGIFLHLASLAELDMHIQALGAYDPERPLWGVPFVVKDNIDVADMPTTAACPDWAYTPAKDAFAIARLRAAGAIPIGKTNLDQFATGLVGIRTPWPVPRNALDAEIVPGGSSSGSAVAVGHGIVPFSLGTDTAGSGRVPAALNGIVGLKPTLGMVSATGVVPACRTLDTISVFARSVTDAHAVLQAMAGYDPADAYARDIPATPLRPAPPHVKVGIPDPATREFFGDALQAAAFDANLGALRNRGAQIVELDFTPFYDVANMLYDGAWVAERHTVIETLLAQKPDAVHPVTRAIIGKAEGLSATDAFRGIYRLAELRRICAPLIASVDLLAVPSIPTFYTLADLDVDPITPNTNLGTYTNFVNLLDLCALTVPMSPRADGRPGSLTLIAPAGHDARLAAEALALSGQAVAAPDAASGDEIALAVCGAHMSGLPLNHQLASLGGRFVRTTETAPCYSFHALAGGPPDRPGLVREAKGGARIALEIWALPKRALGHLMCQIPAPLGLGSIVLCDGSQVTGFLCEAAGTDGARDITALGGWRAYLSQGVAAQ